MRVRSSIVLGALLATLVLAGPVAADCDPAGPPAEVLPTAPVAFVGTATEVVGSMAVFEVHEVWAGPVAGTIEVHGLGSGVERVEDDRTWEAGTTYLVIPWVEGGVLRDSICTATVAWTDDLADLRPSDAVVVEGAPSEGGVPTALLVALGLVVLIGGASVLAFRRRGEQSR